MVLSWYSLIGMLCLRGDEVFYSFGFCFSKIIFHIIFSLWILLFFFISYEILNQIFMWNILHWMCLILLAQHPNLFCFSHEDAFLFHMTYDSNEVLYACISTRWIQLLSFFIWNIMIFHMKCVIKLCHRNSLMRG